MSYPLLENAPPHDTPEFIEYLRENNVVVLENEPWIVIENCKYHRPDHVWYTAFYKVQSKKARKARIPLRSLVAQFGHLEWKKKAAEDQSVKRFHIHMYAPTQNKNRRP